VEALVAQLAAQLAALQEQHDALKAEHTRLAEEHARQARQIATPDSEQRAALPPSLVAAEPPLNGQAGPPSRRELLTRGVAGATAALGAGLALQRSAQPAAAATGSPALLGENNLTETTTQVAYNGPTPIAGKVVFLVNDTLLASTSAPYPAALAGWAGGGKAGVLTGVVGQTSVAGGNGVVGSDTSSTGSGGVGVRGASTLGVAVYGASASTLANARAVVALLSSTTPGAGAAALLGQASGSATGVLGVAASGQGVLGRSTTGPGVQGSSSSGPGQRR
jgi:hypothetical protein